MTRVIAEAVIEGRYIADKTAFRVASLTAADRAVSVPAASDPPADAAHTAQSVERDPLERCIHDLPRAQCDYCRVEKPTFVYYSAGGIHFHLDVDCQAFREGQQAVADRGGVPAPVQTGMLHIISQSRNACRTCARPRLTRGARDGS
jgi:hypothetical protein